MIIQRTFQSGCTHHSDIHCVLREDILQKQVGLRAVPLLHILNGPNQCDRRGGIQHQVKLHIRKVFLDCLFERGLNHHRGNSLFDDIRLLRISDLQTKNCRVFFLDQVCILVLPFFHRRNSIYLMPCFYKKKILI